MAKEIKESPREVIGIVFWGSVLILTVKLYWLIVDLSAYFPLSLLLQNTRFSHYYKKRLIVLHSLSDWAHRLKQPITIHEITEDEYFVYALFTIQSDKKEKRNLYLSLLKRKIGKDNFYLSKKSEDTYQINFIRDNISEKMLRYS